MKFGYVPLKDAEGAILAHALQGVRHESKDRKTYLIPKGTVLSRDHLFDLRAGGHEQVLVAQLEQGDLSEDAAAQKVAMALMERASHLKPTPARTGRVNVIADAHGVLEINAAAVHAANSVDPMITIATAKPYARAHPGFMAATIKIISYGVSERSVRKVIDLSRKAMRIRPPVYQTSALIETCLDPHDRGKLTNKGLRSLNKRLEALHLTAAQSCRVAHDTQSLSDALQAATSDVIFILTASATSDIADIGPSALTHAGGTLTHFGMPVDPGNLLFFGRLGDKPVIGLPGCARSPALNGADWVMQRLLCGVDVTPSDIAAMGVGGLLKEMPDRPQPRDIPLT